MGAPEVIVRTHQHHAIAGESLSGCVYVVAKAPVDIDGLTLHFNGVQQVHVYYQERGATGNSRSQTASSTTRLAGHGCRLHEGGTLAAGTHGFPFEVPLGRGLPASVQRGIMYHLNATLKMRGLLTPDVTKERNVTLLPPCVPAAVLPVDFDPDFKKVDFFCCVSRGHVALAAAVDDAQFDRGDTVEVRVALLNRSSVRPRSIRVTLKEREYKYVDGHSSEFLKTVASGDIVIGRGHNEAPVGMTELSKSELEAARADGKAHGASDALAEVHRLLRHSPMKVTLRVTQDTNYSSRSSRVLGFSSTLSISHRICVEAKMGCCVSNPTIWETVHVKHEAYKTELGGNVPNPVANVAFDDTRLAIVGYGASMASSVLFPRCGPDFSVESEAKADEENRKIAGGLSFLAEYVKRKKLGLFDDSNAETDDGDKLDYVTASGEDPPRPPPLPTVEGLLDDLRCSTDDVDLLKARLNDERWQPLLASLSLQDLVTVVAEVDRQILRPTAAQLLLGARGEVGYKCVHVASLVAAPDMGRCARQNMVRLLLRGATDYGKEGAKLVHAALDPIDRLATEHTINWRYLGCCD